MTRKQGQSENPRNKPYLRRVQAILNSQYAAEESAVSALDWARNSRRNDGSYPTDREIIAEALKALWQSYNPGMEIPRSEPSQPFEIANRVAEAIYDQLVTRLEQGLPAGMAQSEDWKRHRRQVQEDIQSAISTANLTGNSYRYDPDEDDE